MRRLLLVSPHFPPVNLPDMQRVRISLPHFADFGWEPEVLSVRPELVEAPLDFLLERTLPEGLQVWRENAVPLRWTKRLGISNLGLRCFRQLYRRGCRIIEKQRPDLVYFSSTVFTAFPLGRLWKRLYGTPYVLDFQDPWAVGHAADRLRNDRGGVKARLARQLHRALESWTLREADGIVAVSADYATDLRRRHSWVSGLPTGVFPFGFGERDFDVVRAYPQVNRFFTPRNGRTWNGVYVGRGGRDMAPALRVIFGALREGLQRSPSLFNRVRLYFIGTDYAPPPRSVPTVRPVAETQGVADRVTEAVCRIPYFEALQLLLDSDFLIVPGSDDPRYTASKIYPYVLSGKPLISVFHERSSVVSFLRRTGGGRVVTFNQDASHPELIEFMGREWSALLENIGKPLPVQAGELARYGGREMTRRQCRLFDEVVSQQVVSRR